MNDWINRAEAMEAKANLLVKLYPDDWQSRLDSLCWQKWFAWRPVRLMANWPSKDRKWRWLTTVERHFNEPFYRDYK